MRQSRRERRVPGQPYRLAATTAGQIADCLAEHLGVGAIIAGIRAQPAGEVTNGDEGSALFRFSQGVKTGAPVACSGGYKPLCVSTLASVAASHNLISPFLVKEMSRRPPRARNSLSTDPV
jgi:hypothetical protein